jgi:threonyl-tRNA synthetase
VKAFTLTKFSAAYWLGKAENPSLQRIYGMSFPTTQLMQEWKEATALAEARDHRKTGATQKLFFFHEWSPGSPFFLPHGTRIYNTLVDFMRNEYKKRGYKEVITPNVFNIDLWKKSGHYDNYKENMFLFHSEHTEFGVKPMNCPGHCLLYAHDQYSYRDLPIRLADFGVLHRNELSGTLGGLTRVRRFQQDDAHIFCRPNQIAEEIKGVLEFLDSVYSTFGYEYELSLSTRPEKYLGEIDKWNDAENALRSCLESFMEYINGRKRDQVEKSGNTWLASMNQVWKVNPGDGAFYGPKIDILLKDALKRPHQCATIQLDFQLPIQFNLKYKDENNELQHPVIIHRAILGSIERQIAVLLEHTGGKLPFWLSPRQIVILPITKQFDSYATNIFDQLKVDGYAVDMDDRNESLNKRVRQSRILQYNYIAVIGAEEEANKTVTVRHRDQPDIQQTYSLEEFRVICKHHIENKN